MTHSWSRLWSKIEHLAGELNTGADGLSRLQMSDDVPLNLISEIYAIDELDREANTDFPLDMTMIREKQDQDQKLQQLIQRKDKSLSLMNLGGAEVYTIKGKVWVPT